MIPFAPGQLPLVRIQDEGHALVPLTIFGDKDQDGAPYADGRIGLRTNLAYLAAQIFTPNPTPPGTWPLVLHLPDGSTKTAGCFVITPFQMKPISPVCIQGVLDILIPAGVLT